MKKRPFEAVRLTFYISTEQKVGLDRLSEETGAPLTVLVRRALDAYLEAHSEPKRGRNRA